MKPIEIAKRRPMTPARMHRIWLRVVGVCWMCGAVTPERGEGVRYDHKLPLELGGSDEDENIFPLHREPCDRIKTAADRVRIDKAPPGSRERPSTRGGQETEDRQPTIPQGAKEELAEEGMEVMCVFKPGYEVVALSECQGSVTGDPCGPDLEVGRVYTCAAVFETPDTCPDCLSTLGVSLAEVHNPTHCYCPCALRKVQRRKLGEWLKTEAKNTDHLDRTAPARPRRAKVPS